MRAFLLFATFVATVVARPDIGLKLREQGYNYPPPAQQTSSQAGGQSFVASQPAPAPSFVPSQPAPAPSFVPSQPAPAPSFVPSQPTPSFVPSQPAPSSSSFGQSSSSVSSGGNFGQSSNFAPSSGNFGSSQASSGSFSSGNEVTIGESQVIDLSGGSSGGQANSQSAVRQGQAEPIITKHFYIHEAPEEPANVRAQEKVQEVRPQKNYKIIFIKAPSSESAAPQNNYPVYPQNEEKTIVYVLSKKNENNFEKAEIPAPPPAVTSKPEVYFIKYKNNEQADSAVSKIQESFQEGGPGYNSPASFAQGFGASSSGASSGGASSGGAFSGGASSGGASSSSFSQGSSSSFSQGSSSGNSQIGGGSNFGSQSFGGGFSSNGIF